MLGDSLKRKHEGRLKLTAVAGGAGWIAFVVLLVIHLGLQARHRVLVYGVTEYQVEMEQKMATATTYAYRMQSALEQCEEDNRGGDFADALLEVGLPMLLEGIGLPSVVTQILRQELDR